MKSPVVVGGALGSAFVALVMAFLVMANSLGWIHMDTGQMDSVQTFVLALVGVIAIAAPFVVALFVRSRVTSVTTPMVDGQPAALVPLEQFKAMQAMAPQMAPKSGAQ